MMAWSQFMIRETVALFFDTKPETFDRWVKKGVLPELMDRGAQAVGLELRCLAQSPATRAWTC